MSIKKAFGMLKLSERLMAAFAAVVLITTGVTAYTVVADPASAANLPKLQVEQTTETSVPVYNEVDLSGVFGPQVGSIGEIVHDASMKHFWFDVSAHETSQAAVDAGGVVEWMDNYYTSHNYDEGARFFDFTPGCYVHIDGRTIEIEGSVDGNYNYDTVAGVRARVGGYDKVIFQTCTTGGGPTIIYYGTDITQ